MDDMIVVLFMTVHRVVDGNVEGIVLTQRVGPAAMFLCDAMKLVSFEGSHTPFHAHLSIHIYNMFREPKMSHALAGEVNRGLRLRGIELRDVGADVLDIVGECPVSIAGVSELGRRIHGFDLLAVSDNDLLPETSLFHYSQQSVYNTEIGIDGLGGSSNTLAGKRGDGEKRFQFLLVYRLEKELDVV